MNFDWNDEAVGELKRLFDEGYSMSRIAAEMGGTFGHAFSRNSIIGKLHRNGMFRGAPKPVPRPPRQQRVGVHRAKAWKPRKSKSAPVPYHAPAETVPIAPEDTQRCTLMDLTNETCRWPHGEGREMLFCGSTDADLHNGRPYCPQHERMAYAPRTTTRRPFIPMRKAS